MRIIVPLLVMAIAVMIGAGICMNSYLRKSSEEIDYGISQIESDIKNNDWQSAELKLSEINQSWNKTKNAWSMLIDHTEIDNIDNALTKVESYIQSKNNALLMSEIASLKLFIEHIPKREEFAMKNIF